MQLRPFPPRARQASSWLALSIALVIIRLPSLFEPAWSADEGAYADVGRSLDHGLVLYQNVWDNKPPGIYWLAAAVNLGQASALRMQLLLFAVIAIGAAVVWLVARRIASRRTAVLASLLYIAVTGLPAFSGDQLNTEAVAAVPAAAAVLLMVRELRAPSLRRSIAAGGLLAVAFLIDVRPAADLLAVAAVPALVAMARRTRPGGAELRGATGVFAGFAMALGVVAVPLAMGGSLGGFVDVLVHKDTGYLAYFQTQANFGPGIFAPAGAAALAAGALRVMAALAIGGVAAFTAARRGRTAAAIVLWWLSCDLAAVMLDARSFTHYIQLAAPSMALAAGLAAAAAWRWTPRARLMVAGAAVLAVWPLALVALWIPPFSAALATGGAIPALRDPEAGGTVTYFTVGWPRVLGIANQHDFDRTFDDDLYPLNAGIAQVMRSHSRTGDPVYVWGGKSPWTYALADRVPSARFVWMGSAYDVYPDSENVAIADLLSRPPAVLVVTQSLPARVVRFLQTNGYRRERSAQLPADYWLAP